MPSPISINPRARSVALIVGGAFFMVLLDTAIITTSLPRMAQSFDVAPVALSIGLSIYLVSVAAFVPLAGWLSDRFGARRVFLSSIILFSLASLACGMAQTLPAFMAARAFQGLAGALMTPIGRVLVLNHTQKSELVQAMALITWPALTAPVIAPALGGFITTYFSWRWNFLINLPLGVIAFCLSLKFIPAVAPGVRRRFDLRGFLLSGGALVGLLLGLESSAHQWIGRTQAFGLVMLGAVLTVLAVRHLRSADEPLLSLKPFSIPTFFMASLLAGLWVRAGINATPFLLPLMLQLVYGFTPLAAGTYLLVYFLGNLGMKSVSTATLRLFGFRTVIVVNGVLCGLFIMAIAFFPPEGTPPFLLVVLLLSGLTRSLQYSALNTLALADISGPLNSSAATLTSMLMQVSMVLGIALSALILAVGHSLTQSPQPVLLNFQVAFVLMGLLVAAASLVCLRLPRDAGAEVSGHRGP
jgi:EmrB/QacA subfamily drug resistance transporter